MDSRPGIGVYVSIDTRRFVQMNEKFQRKGKILKKDDVIVEEVALYDFGSIPCLTNKFWKFYLEVSDGLRTKKNIDIKFIVI